jgi:hypothetical protein
MSAVGSLESMRSKRLMPRDSALKLPAQSKGSLALDIARDFIARESSKHDRRRVEMDEVDARARTDDGAGGMEEGRLATQVRQLLAAARRMHALMQHALAKGCDLVAADDDGLGVLVRHRLRLGGGEAPRAQRRGLVRDVGLANLGRDHIEGQRQACEKCAAVGRRSKPGQEHAWAGNRSPGTKA